MSVQEKNKRKQNTKAIFDDLIANPSLTKKDLKSKYGEYYTDDIDDYVKSFDNLIEANQKGKLTTEEYNRALRQQNKIQIDTRTNQERFADGLKSFGKTALSIAGNVGIDLAISGILQAGAKAWDDYSNAQEHAIEKGNAALEKYADTQKNLASATNWINENKERYVDLSQRATILGEQGDLTDSEWKEYNELSSQMAQYLPNEISGYNSLGTAMLGVAKSVEKINNALIDEKASKYREQLESAGDILGKFKAEMYQDKTDSTKESGITNQIAAAKQLISLYNEGYRSQEQLSKNSSNWLKFNKMLSDLNLTETLEKAGIEGTGFLGGLKVDDYLNEDNIESLKNYVVDLEAQRELAVDDFKQIISMSMQANKGYQKLISNSPEIDSIMSNMISGIELNDIKKILGTDDISSLSTSVMEKQLRNWSANVYSSLRRAPVQEALNELFTLDDKKATLSYSEYEKAATKAIENVHKETKVFSKQQLKDQSNISNSLDELGTAYNRISDKFKNEEGFSEDFLKNNLGTDQLIALSDIISDSSWTGTYSDALSQLQHQFATNDISEQITSAQTALKSINAATSILSSQATGQSISLEDFNSDELKDYTSALEYNNGALQLNAEKVEELKRAKVKEAIQTNDNLKLEKQSQYMKNIKEIEQLQEQLRGLSDAKSENAEAIQSNIDSLLGENDSLVNQCNQLDLLSASLREATGAYQNWLDKQNTSEKGDMFDDALGAMEHIDEVTKDTDSEYYGRIGRESYKAAVEFIIPESIDSENAEAVSSYINSIEGYFKHDAEGSRIGLDTEEFCQRAIDQGLMVFDEASNSYQIAGQRTMQDFVNGLNLSMPMVQAMFGEMEEFGANWDWADEATRTLGDMGVAAGEAKKRIEELSGNENLDIQIDVSDIDSTEGKITALESTITQMQEYKGTLDVDSSQVDDANAVIQYCITQKQMLEAPAVMSVDTSKVDGEVGNAISLLQQFQEASNNVEAQAAIGADTSEAQGKVDSLVSEIQGLSPEVKAKLSLDGASQSTISASIQTLTPEIMVKAGVDSAVVDSWAAAKKESKGTVTWDNNTGAVDAWAATMHTSNGTVTWGNDISAVRTTFSATGTVNWKNSTPPSSGGHTLNGTAHVSGTAHYPHLVGHANASGNWGTKTGGVTLTGELGREIVVDPYTGTWRTVGDNGAEFTYIPKGSIVFNHLQTEELLKRGFVNSRGKANASGTAMVTGSFSRPQSQIASGDKHYNSSSTSNNSNAVNQNTHAVSQNTSQTQKNTEKIKHSTQVFDWVKTRLEYFANKTKEIADKVTDFVSFKLKESLLKSQSSSIDKEIQAQQQGYDTYMKKAQSVAEKYTYYDKDENKQTLSIPKKYQELVKNGQWNIEDMDTSTDYNKNLADAIQKYQDYIESATDCKQTIQELKNEQMELWEEIINIPIEEAESKIDRLEKKLKGLESASSTIADGGSSISRYAYQIEADTGLKSARKKLENANKKKSDASKKMKSNERELKSSKNDTKNAINSLKYQAKKTENDNLVDKVYANIKNGQYVNTKGLKGEVLKAAKRYNDNLKKQREKQKQYNSSKDSYTTASKNASTAKKNYNAKKSQLSEAQQVIIDNKDKPSYLAQNALLGLQLQRKREESEIYEQTVLKTQENLKNSEAKKKASEKAREKQESLILGNKDFTKNLSKAQLSAIKSGNLVDRTGIKDPKTLEAINKYNQLAQEARTYTEKYNVALKANEEAVANAAQSQAEYAQMALDNEKQKFENIKNHYGSQVDYLKTQLDSLQSKDDLRQEQGGEVLKSQLQRQIDKINEMQKLLKQERTKLQEQLEESVSKGVIKVNSKEWYELKEEIFDIDKQVDGLNKDVLGLQDTIRNETFYKEVNKALEKLDEVRASMETIRNLINEQALFDDDGKFTDAGITAFALDIKTYESNLESLNALIRKRNSMIKNFNGGKNDTGYSQKEFDADMKDIESQIRDMLGNANSARKAIIDTVLSHAKAELDAVNKVIDARSELLKKQKEYYDYDKTLKGKTKDIQLLEQQIAALESVSDAESKSKKAQLAAQLQEQQEDLQDTIFNHQYDLQIQGLDDLKTDLQENYDNYVKELNSNIDKIVDTVKNSTDNIKDCVNTVNSTIGKLLNSFGINGSLFNENVLTRSMDNESQNPYNIGMPDDNVTLHMMKMCGFSGDTNDMNEAIRNMNVPVPTLNLPDIKLPDLIPNYEAFNVQPVIECPITIMGNANENEVKRAIRQMIPEIDKEVQKSIRKDLRKGGWR